MKIKVLSWNVWIDGKFDLICDFLQKSQADIIGLQEVKADDLERDVIGFLKGLGYNCVYEPVEHELRGKKFYDAPALFAKHKIIESKVVKLSDSEPRAAVYALIDLSGTSVNVFSTHLIHSHQKYLKVQSEQAEKLVSNITKEKTILMGDFNSTPESDVISKISKVLVNADSRNLPTWCLYPNGCKECDLAKVDTKLDYIFVSDDIEVKNFEVGSSGGSDHLPIIAQLEV